MYRDYEALSEEVRKLRARLEVDSRHPYDGIYCRDATISMLNDLVDRMQPDAQRYRRLRSFAHPSYNMLHVSGADSASTREERFITVHCGTWEGMDATLDGILTVNTVSVETQS